MQIITMINNLYHFQQLFDLLYAIANLLWLFNTTNSKTVDLIFIVNIQNRILSNNLIYLENFGIVDDLNFGGIGLVAKDFFRLEISRFDFGDWLRRRKSGLWNRHRIRHRTWVNGRRHWRRSNRSSDSFGWNHSQDFPIGTVLFFRHKLEILFLFCSLKCFCFVLVTDKHLRPVRFVSWKEIVKTTLRKMTTQNENNGLI